MSDTTKPATPAKKAARKPAAKPSVGSVWVIRTKGVAEVTRPNGDTARVTSTDGVAAYVLDVPGEFVATVPERGPLKVEAV